MKKEIKKKTIKSNFIYNLTLKLLNIAFPLITFPYVARVLMPTGLGNIEFVFSVINIFILLSQLGIPIYGIRACSKVIDDKDKLSKTIQEILFINFISVITTYFIFILLFFTFFSQSESSNMLIFVAINILFTSLGIEWLYEALEEYKFVTIRSLFIKLITLLMIFLFVRSSNDVFIYLIIIVLSSTFTYLINFIFIAKYVNFFKLFKKYNIKQHLKPILTLFLMSISISIYVNLDKVMLGVLSDNAQIGYYAAANKLIRLTLVFTTTLSVVTLPRISFYVEKKLLNDLQKLMTYLFEFVIMLSIPGTVGLILLSDSIIGLFVGNTYEPSIRIMQILSPLLLLISLSHLLGVNYLIATGKEKIVLISTSFGAILNIILNYLFIPSMLANGAALSTLIAEFSVAAIQIIYTFSFLKRIVSLKNLLMYGLASLPIFFVITIIKTTFQSDIIQISLSVLLSGLSYFGILTVLRNKILIDFIRYFLVFRGGDDNPKHNF